MNKRCAGVAGHSCRAAAVVLTLATFLLAACSGGGGTSGSGSSGGGPPANLSYSQPLPFILNQPIVSLTPSSTGGAVTSYSISPTLPAGLSLSTTTGVISGTPTAVAAHASYTVTASNSMGSTQGAVSLSVVSAALAYQSPYFAYTVGVNTDTVKPLATGFTFTSWSVTPPLPPGLTLSPTDGSISGVPTAAAAAASYKVTAMTSEGQESTNLTIAVAATPLLDLGLSSQVTLLRYSHNSVLSQDYTDRWLLQDFTTGATLATADEAGAILGYGGGSYVDLQNNVMIAQAPAGLDVRSAATGQVLATIPYPAKVSWYRLATDGSYIAAGSPTALMAWSTSGQMLFSHAGDYSTVTPFAAPGQIQVALGPAGQSVIETVAVPSGTATVSASFLGVFNSWFVDGQRFLTNQGNTVWTYSSAAAQQNLTTVNTFTQLVGQGNYFWTYASNTVGYPLSVYAVGTNSGPLLTTQGDTDTAAIPSGNTIGVLAYGTGQLTIIDLSGAMPVVGAPNNVPYAYLSAYAAQSASQWLVGNEHGVIFDGTSIGNPRTLTLGEAWAVAAGTSYISVATASGKMVYFNAIDGSQAGTITFSSSRLLTSADGTVLAAGPNTNDAQYEPAQTANIYSLPSGTTISTFPNNQFSGFIALAQSGTLAALSTSSTAATCPSQSVVVPLTGGAPLYCLSAPGASLVYSPDLSLVASSSGPSTSNLGSTNIYKNGTLATAVPGVAVGWLDDNRLVLNEYSSPTDPYGPIGPVLSGTAIYDAAGHEVGPIPFVGLSPFQVVPASSGNSVYNTDYNTIVSLTQGSTIWASGNMARASNYTAVSGSTSGITGTQVIFASDSLVLAQPY